MFTSFPFIYSFLSFWSVIACFPLNSNRLFHSTYTFNVWRAVASSGLHWDIIIFLKVDAGVAPREKLAKKIH